MQEEQVVWDDIVRDNIYVICNTPMAVGITRRTLFGFRDVERKANIKDEQLIKRASNDQEGLVKELKTVGFWKGNSNKQEMKFNAVVGNPPYQEEGISTRKSPIYHLFYDIAFKLSSKVTLITPGRFLFKAGQTPSDWMDKILNDNHFKVVKYIQKSTDIFDNVDIKGGVVITYRDDKANFGPIGTFIEYEELKAILQKVIKHECFKKDEFGSLISSRGMYRFSDSFFQDYPAAKDALNKGTGNMITSNSFELYQNIFLVEKPKDGFDYIKLFGRVNNQRVYRWIKRDYVQPNDYLDTYNVFVPEANGTGAIGEVLSTPVIGVPVIGVPVIGHTDTFLSIGKFTDAQEADRCLKYVKSKFARCMLGTLKATQHNPRDTWANVPMQDFTSNSDIDWNKSIPEIDQQLYAKYGLDVLEIEFIESMIKPME